MTTIADVRARIRKDLHDTDDSRYRWPDSQLDRHIERALDELSFAIPQEKTASLATTPGSRELSLSSLIGLVDVEKVEYPAGYFPPEYVDFSRWSDTLTLNLDIAPSGEMAGLFYTARHTLDESGTSLPGFLEDLVCMGAAAYAAVEQSVFTIDRLNTSEQVARDYEDWGRARLTAFTQLLYQYGRASRVRTRLLRRPA